MTEKELEKEQKRLAKELVKFAVKDMIFDAAQVRELECLMLRMDALNRGAFYLMKKEE